MVETYGCFSLIIVSESIMAVRPQNCSIIDTFDTPFGTLFDPNGTTLLVSDRGGVSDKE